MDLLFNVMIFFHVIGAAMVVGIWIANMKAPTVHPRQFDGAILQLITGIVMLGLIPALGWGTGWEYYVRYGIKFLFGIVIAIAAFIGARKHRKGEPVSTGLAHAVGGLGLINIGLATLWN
ncbi:hypothetical protein [Arthrobacter castelli]|uniref:hypothetical protein n=1 Tax=Arthrobacter castelli TaxID=271431 RepID=UPI0003FA2713|nr:hypothetical protein [Arthrobacter castelli]